MDEDKGFVQPVNWARATKTYAQNEAKSALSRKQGLNLAQHSSLSKVYPFFIDEIFTCLTLSDLRDYFCANFDLYSFYAITSTLLKCRWFDENEISTITWIFNNTI